MSVETTETTTVEAQDTITEEVATSTGDEVVTTESGEQALASEVVKCAICGKALIADESVVRGIGPVCFPRVVGAAVALAAADGIELYTDAEPRPEGDERPTVIEFVNGLEAERFNAIVAQTKDESSFKIHGFEGDPEAAGYVKLSVLVDAVKAANKSIASMVRAMGGDRKVKPAIAPYWEPVYAAGTRWVPAEALDHVHELNDAKGSRKAAVPAGEELEIVDGTQAKAEPTTPAAPAKVKKGKAKGAAEVSSTDSAIEALA